MMRLTSLLIAALMSSPVMAKDLTIVGQDYPPFNWMEGTEVKGGMVDVIQSACDKLKHNCKFSIVPLARALQMLKDGEADAVMSLIPNSDRAVFSQFSPIIAVSNLAYMGAKGKVKKVTDLKDANGWTVGVARASSSQRVASKNQEQAKNMTLVEESNNETMIKKLQGDRYGAQGVVFGGDAVLEYFAKQVKLDIEVVLNDSAQGFMTAFSKKSVDAKLFADFTSTIEAMKKSGEVKTLLAKYALRTE